MRFKPITNTEISFWDRVLKGSRDECWPFTGSTNNGGYGSFYLKDRVWGAHRLAFFLSNRERFDASQLVLHSCDNRICCNPNHLSQGTHKENTRQCVERNRCYRGVMVGEANHNATLTENQVRRIIQQLKMRTRSSRQLAAKYGVTVGTIYHIRSVLTWKHLPR